MKLKKDSVLNNQGGFTLIEIIAVLIILGILAAVAVPKYMDLQNQARIKAADAAIAEAKSRLSNGYGQFLLENKGSAPANVLAICALIDDDTILPRDANGAIPMGTEYTVTLATDGTITVTHVQGVALDAAVTSTWTMP